MSWHMASLWQWLININVLIWCSVKDDWVWAVKLVISNFHIDQHSEGKEERGEEEL